MLDPIVKRWGKLQEIVGAEVRWNDSGAISIHWVRVKVQKGDLTIIKEGKFEGEFTTWELPTELQIPWAVWVEGKGILTKKVEVDPDQEPEILIQKALPNAKMEDFYFQSAIGKQGTWITLVRKEIINQWISQWETKGIKIISLHAGPSPMVAWAEAQAFTQGDLVLGSFVGRWNSQLLDQWYATPSATEGFGTSITDKNANQNNAAFAVCLNFFLDSDAGLAVPTVENQRDEARNKFVFEKLGWIVLGTFLGILLVNFGVYSWLASQKQELEMRQSLFSGQIEKVKALQQSVTEKESFLKQTGWMDAPKLSFYADRIASTLPKGIALTQLVLHPVDVQLQDGQKDIHIEAHTIQIKGESNQPSILNDWVLTLKYFDWVSQVKIVDYTLDSDRYKGIFSIEIQVK